MEYKPINTVDFETVIDKELIDHLQNGIINNEEKINDTINEQTKIYSRLNALENRSNLTLELITSSINTIVYGSSFIIEYLFTSSINGNGIVNYYVNGELKIIDNIPQGNISFDISPYLNIGNNDIVIEVKDKYGTTNSINLKIETVVLKITSDFDDSVTYNSNINFIYKCIGKSIKKTVYFYLDDMLYDTVDVGTSHNVELRKTIEISSHGSHLLEVYFKTSNDEKSNSILYDIKYDMGDSEPIISCVYTKNSITYGDTIELNYSLYTHNQDYTNELTRTIYYYNYELSSETVEGSLEVVSNDTETLTDSQVKIQDVNNDSINIGDYVSKEKVIYSSNNQTSILNNVKHSWIIQNYLQSGRIYLELKSSYTVKTISIFVNKVDLEYDFDPVSTGLILNLNALNKSNNDTNKNKWTYSYTTIDDITTTINSELSNFNFSSNGWVTDNDGFPVLRHTGNSKTIIKMPIFLSNYTDENGKNVNLNGTAQSIGRTIEIEFKSNNVTNYDNYIIRCFNDTKKIGFVVNPTSAYILNDSMSISRDENGEISNKDSIPYVSFKENERIRVSFVIEKIGHFIDSDDNSNKQMIRIYINGELSKAINYDDSSSFTISDFIEIGSNTCITDIYSIRVYDKALEDFEVLQNYIADKNSIQTKIEIYKDNDVLDDFGNVDYDLCKLKYPCILVTGKLSEFKGDKTNVGIIYTKPDKTEVDGYSIELDCMEQVDDKYICQSNVQGTSSQRYAKKNYKFTFKNLVNGTVKKTKYKLKNNDSIGESTLCYKADYMSPNHANTANANFLSTLFEEKVPPQNENENVQITIYGYRCLLFQRNTINDKPVFQGDGCLNNDKGNSSTFGLENDTDSGNNTKCQKWEFLDNSQEICNFKTDTLMKKNNDKLLVLSALESSYPDQGDLEDEGLLPNYNFIQILFSWVCRRANFLTASKEISETAYEYNNEIYNTEYDYKYAIFKNEFTKHFNLNHVLTYYLALEYVALVDNRAKNMFLTCYDTTEENIVFTDPSITSLDSIINSTTGVLDISKIDWEQSTFAKWYTSLYDMDSCLGVENSGLSLVPYYAEWDYKHENQYIFNGADSYFWQMVEIAFRDEIITLFKKLRTNSKLLTYSNFYKYHITDNSEAVCSTIINQDARFKYIDIWREGYLKYQEDNINQDFIKTSDYMYLVKGSMKYNIIDFMNLRDKMLSSKYISSDYKLDKIDLRIGLDKNGDGSHVKISVVPSITMYCYSEYGNNSDYIGQKTPSYNSCEMIPAAGNYRDILMSIYGASYLSSIGDISHLIPYSIDLSNATRLQELILGNNDSNFSNNRLSSLSVNNNLLLTTINVQNCVALTGSLNLTNCNIIENIYADGSSLGNIILPVGGYIKKLYLPNTITNLTVRDHKDIEEFVLNSYDNIQKLWIENDNNHIIPSQDIIKARGNDLSRIRLIGVDWDLTDESVEDENCVLNIIINESMSNKQINALGEEVEGYPIITGKCHIGSISSDILQTLSTLYPNLSITYDEIIFKIVFKNYDNTILYSEYYNINDIPTDPVINNLIPVPRKETDNQYSYNYIGWDHPLTAVSASNCIYIAVFEKELRKYRASFYTDSITLGGILINETESDDINELGVSASANYGSNYKKPILIPDSTRTPSDTTKGYKFLYWTEDPTISNNPYDFSTTVTGDITLYGYYEEAAKEEIPTSQKNFIFTPIRENNDESGTILSYSIKQNPINPPSGLLVFPSSYGDYDITEIDSNGFNGISVEKIIFLSTSKLEKINDNGFSNILRQIDPSTSEYKDKILLTLPKSVKYIENNVFENSTGIGSILIPNTIEKIGENLIYSSGVETITFGSENNGIKYDIDISTSAFNNDTTTQLDVTFNIYHSDPNKNQTYIKNYPWGKQDTDTFTFNNISAYQTYTLKFYNYPATEDTIDNYTPLTTRLCIKGLNAEDPVGASTLNSIETPTYTDPQYTYTYSGWDKSLENITADTNFFATYITEPTVYQIRFLYNGEVLQKTVGFYGSVVEYTGEIPVKDYDGTHEYLFAGWNEPDHDVTPITGNQDYEAVFETIEVPDLNQNNITIETSDLGYGYINSTGGITVNDTTKICTKNRYIPISNNRITLKISDGYVLNVAEYSSELESGFIKITEFSSGSYYFESTNTSYLKFTIYKSDNSIITESDFETCISNITIIGIDIKSLEECTWGEILAIGKNGYKGTTTSDNSIWYLPINIPSIGEFNFPYFNIGDKKTIILKTNEVITVRIEDFNHDTDKFNSTLPFTFGLVGVLNTMPSWPATQEWFALYYYLSGGATHNLYTNSKDKKSSRYREYYTLTTFNKFPYFIRNIIVPTKKNTHDTTTNNYQMVSYDTLFPFSLTELGLNTYDNDGKKYPLFINNGSRMRKKNNTYVIWTTRNYTGTSGIRVGTIGSGGIANASVNKGTLFGVVFAFCTSTEYLTSSLLFTKQSVNSQITLPFLKSTAICNNFTHCIIFSITNLTNTNIINLLYDTNGYSLNITDSNLYLNDICLTDSLTLETNVNYTLIIRNNSETNNIILFKTGTDTNKATDIVYITNSNLSSYTDKSTENGLLGSSDITISEFGIYKNIIDENYLSEKYNYVIPSES